jgi:hypothetical protein
MQWRYIEASFRRTLNIPQAAAGLPRQGQADSLIRLSGRIWL